MPVYDYECTSCGEFTAFRPMANYADPMACPECGNAAPRILVVAPALASMDAGKRRAFATNERASHEPKLSAHGAKCACCKPQTKQKTETVYGEKRTKSFPSRRPWMIGH